MANKNIFDDAQIAKQARVLVHDSNAIALSIERRAQVAGVSINQHGPNIGPVNPANNLNTCTFASSILAK
jgi:hypothetical protein